MKTYLQFTVMKVFLWHGDEYVGQSVMKAALTANATVATTLAGTGVSVARPGVSVIRKENKDEVTQALLDADVIIYPVFGLGDESAPCEFAVQFLHDSLAGIDDNDEKAKRKQRKRTFIAISTVLTWARTNETESNDPDEIEAMRETVLTEDDYKKRKPIPSFKHVLACEKAVSRLRRKGLLETIVVWAGLCYGNGEWMLHGWFKDAWGLKQPSLDLYGKGQNVVPMIHVDDLAGVALALATQPDPPRHVVACDEAKSTLAEIAGAINSELGTGNPLGVLKPEETILIKDIELFLTDLRFEPTSCLNTEYQFKYQEGFVARIGDVVTDFRKVRNLTPVKVIVTGPPMSGKTVLAAQIARHYHIHHITATDVIHEYLASCDEDGLAEVAASKEENNGRIGDDLLTRMFRRKLSSKPCVNQGYVLDGYPKTAAQNLLLFGEDAVIEDEPATQVPPNINPDHVVVLAASDEFLADRVMSLDEKKVVGTHNDADGFRRRLEFYRVNNTDTNTFVNLFEERDIPPLVLNVDGGEDPLPAVILRVGAPRNYGPTRDEVAEMERQRQAAEDRKHEERRAAQERNEAEELERRRRRDEKERKRLIAIQQQERDNLDVHAMPLRKYLLENVMPTVTEALIEICKVRPEDPLDYLAEYLFRASPEVSRK